MSIWLTHMYVHYTYIEMPEDIWRKYQNPLQLKLTVVLNLHEGASSVWSSILNCWASLQFHHGVNLVSNPKFTHSIIFRMFLTVHLTQKVFPRDFHTLPFNLFMCLSPQHLFMYLAAHLGHSASNNHTWSFVSGFLHLAQCYQESFTVQAMLTSLGFTG